MPGTKTPFHLVLEPVVVKRGRHGVAFVNVVYGGCKDDDLGGNAFDFSRSASSVRGYLARSSALLNCVGLTKMLMTVQVFSRWDCSKSEGVRH
jgi:hypothetical protein